MDILTKKGTISKRLKELISEISEIQADIIIAQKRIQENRKLITQSTEKEKVRLLKEIELFQAIIIRNRAKLDQKEAEQKELLFQLNKK